MEHSLDFPDSFYRVTIKGLCVRDGKLFLVHESPELSGYWEMPGGGLDFGEDIEKAFRREVQEEMGLTVSKMSKRPVYVWSYKYENRRNLDWYYAFVVAYRVEFEDLNFIPTPECDAIQFFSKEDLQQAELTGQSNVLRHIFDPKDFEEDF
jgi:8-oxo-dGTP diphosphatase